MIGKGLLQLSPMLIFSKLIPFTNFSSMAILTKNKRPCKNKIVKMGELTGEDNWQKTEVRLVTLL